ncbi:MAG TPA: helix-turn-helix domain-containing protein [Tepidisphaeraceae bacterium]|jgi:putative transcriptional regulator
MNTRTKARGAISTKRSRTTKGTAAGRELIAALREAVHAATTGDTSRLTIREVEIPDPADYGPKDIKRLRASMGVSQGIFARLLGVSPELVAHWEYGIRKPAPLARRLMDKVKQDPAAYMAELVRRRTVAGNAPRSG